MKIFYLNCFRLLKNNKKGQRDWLIDYIIANDVDVACLAESSNYDIGDALPERFPKQYRWKPAGSKLNSMGFKFNICSRHSIAYAPIDYAVSDEFLGDGDTAVLADYGIGTMVCMKFEGKDYEVVCVHIQHKKSKSQRLTKGNAFYEYGLRTLLDYMVKNEPIAVFGDFNNYPNDKSFLALSDNTGYINAHTGDVRYTYKNNAEDTGSVIDHTFTRSGNVRMEYVDAISHGFNHQGMLIKIE